MKRFKVLFIAILTLLMSFAIIGTSSVSAAGDKLYVKVYGDSNKRSGNNLYTVTNSNNVSGASDNQVFKLVGKINSNSSDSEAYSSSNPNKMLYCLKEGVGLATESGEKSAIYDISYNLKSTIPANYRACLPSSEDNYNKMAWVLENLVDPYKDDEVRALFEKIEQKYDKDLDIDTLLNNQDLRNTLIDVIEVSQQSALWKFTNDGEIYEPIDCPLFKSNGASYSDVGYYLNGENPYLYLYLYLVSEANSAVAAGYTYDQPKTNTDVKINVVSTQEENTDDYLIGPVTIDGMNYITNIKFKDITGLSNNDKMNPDRIDQCSDVTNFNIYNKNKNLISGSDLTAKIKSNGKNEFYIGVPKSSVPTNTNTIKEFSIVANATIEDREVTIWTASTNTDRRQPVAVIKNTTKPVVARANFTVSPKRYDLALRKFITRIERNGQDVYASNPKVYADRVPKITPDNLRAFARGDSAFGEIVTTPDTKTTIVKQHEKDVLDVQPGDVITYTIRVYNEGNEDANGIYVYDQWDANYGLEYVSSEGWMGSGNVYSAQYSGTISKFFIQGKDPDTYTLEDLDYHDFTIKCKVKSDAPVNKALRNVAEVYYAHDENGMKRDNDIDSYYSNLVFKYNVRNTGAYNVEWAKWGKGYEDDDDFEQVRIPENPKYDLALRKYISKIENSNGDVYDYDYEARNPNFLGKNIKDFIDGKSIFVTTIEKDHTKEPLTVHENDIVTYCIVVYNEGGLSAGNMEVTDYLPEGLEYIDNEYNRNNLWVQDSQNPKIVRSRRPAGEEYEIPAFDKDRLNPLCSVAFRIQCRVTENATNDNLRNIAEISDDDRERYGVEDIDSNVGNVNRTNYSPKDPTRGLGEEDDDDYEDLRLAPKPGFDLALRKYIVGVNEDTINDRVPNIATSALGTSTSNPGTATTADYKHRKDAVEVKAGDIVKYKISTYNEGNSDGYVFSISDYLPNYLEFVPTDNFVSSVNTSSSAEYVYTFDESSRKLTFTKNATASAGEKTYLYFLNQYTGNTLDHGDIEFYCKVKDNYEPSKDTYLTNVATMDYGTSLTEAGLNDRDSSPATFDVPGQDKLVSTDEFAYYGNTSNKKYLADSNYHYKGQEDDDDFEKLLVKGVVNPKFDLALRKFITSVRNEKSVYTYDREPEITQEALKNLAEGTTQFDDGQTAVKKHSKEPIQIRKGYSIVYTIRVYNEGDIDGTATEITDYLPEGLNLKADSEINTKYGWTADSNDPKKVKTNYLANKNIKAFSKEKNADGKYEISYEDVQIECTVIDTLNNKTNLKNVAEITDDNNEDRDSTPKNLTDEELKNYKPGTSEDGKGYEDDDDYEDLCVYDLALRKWVTTAIVIEDDVKKVMYTGHKAEDDPESIVKVEVNDKRIKSAVVKFIYSIRITNEGAVDAKCEEITDYIPEGLKFVKDDNPYWTQDSQDERIIRTDKLKNTTLKPGEAAEVEVALTWINDENNLGVKINTAEISKDDGLDIDSEPNNKVEGEDDIDTAPVALTIVTGSAPLYISLVAGLLFIIGSGIVVIKKVVL